MTNEIREAGVRDMLRARDERCERQRMLLAKHGLPLISFTMNIAGPVKTDGRIRRAFFEGTAQVEAALAGRRIRVCEKLQSLGFTGDECIWAADAPAPALKAWMREIEESHPLGRLFDLDVLDTVGMKLAREGHRKCLICGGDVHICARSRAHSAGELYLRAREIIGAFFDGEHARFIAACAQNALLAEAAASPKPGLVDAENSGAHRDMDLFTFAASAAALGEWFYEAARIGAGMRGRDMDEAFARLRAGGLRAEGKMLAATGGVNTHKGALFSLGILCCAAGMAGENAGRDEIFGLAAQLARPSLADLTALDSENARTGGERQYLEMGLTGIRGEAAAGFPTVREWGLPALEGALHRGLNDALLHALLAMMARLEDSNILRRRGRDALAQVQAKSRSLLENGFIHDDLRRMNDDFVRENISPGGSADLLAAAYFIHLISGNHGGTDHERNP